MLSSGKILRFRPYRGPTSLRGYLDFALPDLGLELRDVMVHQNGASRWLAFPGVPQKTKDGTPLLDPRGKPVYRPPVRWTGDTWESIKARVISTLIARYPEAFDTLPGGRTA